MYWKYSVSGKGERQCQTKQPLYVYLILAVLIILNGCSLTDVDNYMDHFRRKKHYYDFLVKKGNRIFEDIRGTSSVFSMVVFQMVLWENVCSKRCWDDARLSGLVTLRLYSVVWFTLTALGFVVHLCALLTSLIQSTLSIGRFCASMLDAQVNPVSSK